MLMGAADKATAPTPTRLGANWTYMPGKGLVYLPTAAPGSMITGDPLSGQVGTTQVPGAMDAIANAERAKTEA